jgi:hypothetical protein
VNTEDVILAAVARCDRIVAGVDELRPFLDPILPVSDDDFSKLPVVARIASVALLKRYEQLQDMLGRLFRAYLDWELEDVRAMTRRDQANQLERFGIVENADDWVEAAELHNRLVHEYPVGEVEQVDRVNDCYVAIFRLVRSYAELRRRLHHRGLLA